MATTESIKNLWKIGSRWNDAGAPGDSVLELFNRHQMVFVGSNQDIFNRIQIGDLLAIADGTLVVAIGEAISRPQAITELSASLSADDEATEYCYQGVLACRARMVFLKEADCFRAFDGHKGRRGAAFRLPGKLEHVMGLWDTYRSSSEVKKEFSIKASSCSLLGQDGLLDKPRRFLVPIYQRPYSWREDQVVGLLSDILLSFRGTDGNESPEPMFIGTMQISGPKKVDVEHGVDEHDIIDGQQRLSTLLLLLEVVRAKLGGSIPDLLRSFPVGWLRTDVDQGAQQKYLKEFLGNSTRDSENRATNPYLRNALLLEQRLAEEAEPSPSEIGPPPLDLAKFAEYLLTRVYFVVVETQAGLSKTLQIFKAINTAGLDLNSEDIFKLRCYEYLRDVKHEKDANAAFQNISALYESIDSHNRKLRQHVFGMDDILAMYQHILVARHGLPIVLHNYGTDTFFQRLVDVTLRVDKWEHFQGAANVEISLDDLRHLIKVRCGWAQAVQGFSGEAKCATHFIGLSRYGRYSMLPLLFRFRYGDTAPVERLVRQLAKLLIIYSVCFRRAIYDISYAFWADLAKDMFATKVPEICATSLVEKVNNKARKQIEFLKLVELDIASISRSKNLLCRLSAMLDEDQNDPRWATDDLVKNLFQSEIDIEHIEAINNRDGTKREEVWKDWGDELNRIGNLMVLEQTINRSVKNGDYRECKVPAYKGSMFKTVRRQADCETWDLDHCLERKKREVEKLLTYLRAD